jgi:predicted dienelactone hydrolase
MKRVICAALMVGMVLGVGAQKKPKVVATEAISRVGVVTRVFHPAAQRNWRGAENKELDAVVWYPAIDTAIETKQIVGPPDSPLFEAGSAMPHAAFAPKLERSPLILLSHGTGGSAIQMAWLGTALARAGYIAVAVDHPGNNSNAKLTPEGFALWWERATDLSNVLDAMLKDEEFGSRIDATRVAAAGYSLGGYTVMELGGAQTDFDELLQRCRVTPGTDNARSDTAVCHVPEMRGMGSVDDILAATRKTSRESLARSGGSFRDPRVKAVFAIAPALGFTQTPESLHAMRVPVEMVVGTEDKIAPAKENAEYLRTNLHGARETVLPGVSHYTFLDTCAAAGKDALPQFCNDAPGVDRDAVHEKVSGMAITFFDRSLKWR